ncbi:MAG: helix-turn-helix domain-containing protein [Nitrospirota bacterium]
MGKSKTDCRQSGCPIAFTLDLLGDKWSLLIIRDMIFKGRCYFGEFLEANEKIATNILTDRLKKLEDSEIVTKTQDPEHQKKYIYELTPKGVGLIPVILEVILWGTKNDPNTKTPKELFRRLNKDKSELTREIIEAVKNHEPALNCLSSMKY